MVVIAVQAGDVTRAERARDLVTRFWPLVFMGIFPVLGWIYTSTNSVENGQVTDLTTGLDEATPFIPAMAVPYLLWMPFIYACCVYFLIREPRVYLRTLAVYALAALACAVVYSYFQTTVPRPEVTGTDPFSELVKYIYAKDPPYNCLPSIHCFSSYLVARMVWTAPWRNRRNVTLITSMGALVIASTLLVKQHVIADVITALLLVEVVLLVVLAAERFIDRVVRPWVGTMLSADRDQHESLTKDYVAR